MSWYVFFEGYWKKNNWSDKDKNKFQRVYFNIIGLDTAIAFFILVFSYIVAPSM